LPEFWIFVQVNRNFAASPEEIDSMRMYRFADSFCKNADVLSRFARTELGSFRGRWPAREDEVVMTAITDESALIAQVARIIRQVAKIKPQVPISADSRLVDDLAIDSLDLVAIVIQLQDDFQVAIDEDALPQLRRVSDLAAYVGRRRPSSKVP